MNKAIFSFVKGKKTALYIDTPETGANDLVSVRGKIFLENPDLILYIKAALYRKNLLIMRKKDTW